jgi:hypothetical protein
MKALDGLGCVPLVLVEDGAESLGAVLWSQSYVRSQYRAAFAKEVLELGFAVSRPSATAIEEY